MNPATTGVRFRDATPADAPALAKCHAALFDPPWDAAAFANLIASDTAIAIVAHESAHLRPIGFLLASSVVDEAEILTIGVSASHQNQGIAAALLHRLIERLAGKNVTRLFLEVAADNTPARALYARAGFKAVGERTGYYTRPGAPARDALLLALNLAD